MTAPKERVILLHGFGAGAWTMLPLAWELGRQGYESKVWGYPSFQVPVELLAKKFAEYLHSEVSQDGKVHIVAHSMGSLVTCKALTLCPLKQVRRIVFLAPPFSGSPVASMSPKLLRSLFPPLTDLSTDHKHDPEESNSLKECEVAVIAALYDAVIPVANSHFPNEKCHVVVSATHNSILVSHRVRKLVVSFLRTGKF